MVPFNLTTVDRGTEKNRKLQELKEKEEQELLQAAQFKANPVRTTDTVLPERVKSAKKPTRPLT